MNRTAAASCAMIVAVALALSPALIAGEVSREQLHGKLERLAQNGDPRVNRPAIALLTQLDYYEYTHGGGGYVYWGKPTLEGIAADAAKLAAGQNPFAEKRGNFLKGYLAENDRSRQPYSISVPEAYAGKNPIPLLVDLHSHGWTQWYRQFQGHPAVELNDMIVVAPHGRGSCDYMWIAEDDVLAVIDDVMRDYSIDGDRVYVTGYSMGGTGSWNMAVRFPDRFAGSYPVAGNADISAWTEAWKKKEDRKTPLKGLRWFMRTNTSPVTFAENLAQMPVRCAHGALDSIAPVGHARSIIERLKQLKYDKIEYAEDADAGHFGRISASERAVWLRRFRRDPFPTRVRYKTAWYRYSGAYWVEIVRFVQRMKFAEIDARVLTRSRIDVKADNIALFKLKLDRKLVDLDKPLTVVVNKCEVLVPELPKDRVLWLQRGLGLQPAIPSNGQPGKPAPHSVRWSIASAGADKPERKFPPRKRKGLEGPIDDCFRERFLIVYGTQGGDEWRKEIVRREALRWCRQWKRRFAAMPPHKADREVTEDDIRLCNLILFGGPSCNSISARVASKLPVRPDGDRIIAGERSYSGDGVGMKACYPNPLQPRRMVVLFAANSWKGMWQMSHRFGNWFDWVPYDNRDWFDYAVFDDKTTGPETFIEFGFLDDDWRLNRKHCFLGVEEHRSRAVARRYPAHLKMPGRKTVYLSDVMPTEINTAKGPLVFDRSWEFNGLSIGSRRFEKGFGQKVMSSVEYQLGGRFKTFEAWVGVDLEGLSGDDLSEERKMAESVLFQVYGDGKLLGSAGGMGWNIQAKRIRADVEGIRVLRLITDKQTPEGWHYGSVAWGNARLMKSVTSDQ